MNQQKAVAAEIEKAVVDAGTGDSESVCKERTENFLLWSNRSTACRVAFLLRSRQRFVIDFAVWSDGKLFHPDDCVGQHVVRQPGFDLLQESPH